MTFVKLLEDLNPAYVIMSFILLCSCSLILFFLSLTYYMTLFQFLISFNITLYFSLISYVQRCLNLKYTEFMTYKQKSLPVTIKTNAGSSAILVSLLRLLNVSFSVHAQIPMAIMLRPVSWKNKQRVYITALFDMNFVTWTWLTKMMLLVMIHLLMVYFYLCLTD